MATTINNKGAKSRGVVCTKTFKYWHSINQAGRALKISAAVLKKHLDGTQFRRAITATLRQSSNKQSGALQWPK